MSPKRILLNYLWTFPSVWLGLTFVGVIDGITEGQLATGAAEGFGAGLYWGTAALVLYSPVILLVLSLVDYVTSRMRSEGTQHIVAATICGFAALAAIIGSDEPFLLIIPAGAMIYALSILRLPPLGSTPLAD